MRTQTHDRPITVSLLFQQTVLKAGLALLVNSDADLHVLPQNEKALGDVTLFDLNDEGALEALRESCETSHFIALSDPAEPDELTEVLQAGARGVVIKTAHPKSLLEAIRSVATGQRWIDPELQEQLMSADRLLPTQSARWETLTDREREVATLVIGGSRYRAIAEHLNISEHTVRNHLRNIFTKLQITSRVELAPYAAMLQSA